MDEVGRERDGWDRGQSKKKMRKEKGRETGKGRKWTQHRVLKRKKERYIDRDIRQLYRQRMTARERDRERQVG